MTTNIEDLTIWWADIKLERVINGQYYISADSFERPVIIINNTAYLVFKITSRTDHPGYLIRDWQNAGLSRPSVIRTDVLVPVAMSDLKEYMGKLSINDQEGLINYLQNQPTPRYYGRNP